ncbi:MAG: CoA transferase [Chloroflexota bacterium]
MAVKQALEGLKVLDFTWVAAGPLLTKYLADHGAQVVKVESATAIDSARPAGPYKDNIPGINRGGTFVGQNSSKYSLALDLNNPKQSEVTARLVAWADVVVEAFTPRTVERWGLGYEQLKKTRPDIVMVSCTSQGQTGPDAKQPGYGWLMNAMVGFAHLTGWPDREPSSPAAPYTDVVLPWFGVAALMAALDYRRRTGKGQHIDISHLETGLTFLRLPLLDYTANGREQTRRGNSSLNAAPHGVYRCLGDERWCAIAVHTEEEWQGFCRALGNPPWTRDPRFATLASRRENAAALDHLIEAWTQTRTPEEAMALLQSHGVAAGVVQSCQDILDKDPQLRHRGSFQRLRHSEIGECNHRGWPAHLSQTPARLRPAPCLGEHTEYVLTQVLGFSPEEFQELSQSGLFK